MKYLSKVFVLCITILFLSQSLFAASIDWEKIREGIHVNKDAGLKFGGSVGGGFSGNAYMDLDLLPAYGKAGIGASAYVFMEGRRWNVIKADGYVEGGLNVKTSLDVDTEELLITFWAGTDAVVNLNFLQDNIIAYSVNSEREKNGETPFKREWSIPIKVTQIMPLLEQMGNELGIGKEGAFRLLADAATETVKILIKESASGNPNLVENVGTLLANYFYKIASLKLDKDYNDRAKLLRNQGYSSLEIYNAITKGQGNGELCKIKDYKFKKVILSKLFWTVKFLLNYSNAEKSKALTLKVDKQYKFEKRLPGYSNTFFIAFVPITINVGGSAAIGTQVSLGLKSDDFLKNKNSKFFINVGPFVSAGAYASAAVDLLVAKGGVEGTLDLIEDNLSLGMDAPFPKVWTNIDGSINNGLTTLKGKIKAFVSWKEPRIGWRRVCKRRKIYYMVITKGKKTHKTRVSPMMLIFKKKLPKGAQLVCEKSKKKTCRDKFGFYWKSKKKSKTLFKFNGPVHEFEHKLF